MLPSYSSSKFLSFSPQQRRKAIHKLLRALDIHLKDPQLFAELSQTCINCLSWLPEGELQEFIAIRDALALAEPRTVMQSIWAYWSELGLSYKDSQIPVLKGDGPRSADQDSIHRAGSIVVILDNLRSVFNVGSIFRSSECLGLAAIALCGCSPGPEHHMLAKTAMNTQERLAWHRFENSLLAIEHYRQAGYKIVALETVEGAISPYDYQPDFPLALILGNESLGIDPKVLSEADDILALPVQGWKNSLNVGVAFAVCAYQLVFGA